MLSIFGVGPRSTHMIYHTPSQIIVVGDRKPTKAVIVENRQLGLGPREHHIGSNDKPLQFLGLFLRQKSLLRIVNLA